MSSNWTTYSKKCYKIDRQELRGFVGLGKSCLVRRLISLLGRLLLIRLKGAYYLWGLGIRGRWPLRLIRLSFSLRFPMVLGRLFKRRRTKARRIRSTNRCLKGRSSSLKKSSNYSVIRTCSKRKLGKGIIFRGKGKSKNSSFWNYSNSIWPNFYNLSKTKWYEYILLFYRFAV